MMVKEPKSTSSFRDDLSELESITARLESDSVDLDDALKDFERGNELVVKLKAQLEAAEQTVRSIDMSTSSEEELS